MNMIPINPVITLDYMNFWWTVPTMFFLLLFGHFLADYPLQGDFIAKAKNKFHPVKNVPWFHVMTAHCGIHAGFVMIFTGYFWLGMLEFFTHFVIDYKKCASKISFEEDQFLHIVCKVSILILWIILSF